MKAGIAISPDTPSTAISDEVGNAVDMILVMTVYPGKLLLSSTSKYSQRLLGQGGQKFIERCVPKVSELRARFPEQNIEVDGGVGPSTVEVCANAGSNVIVAGTAIFNAEEPETVIKQLKTAVDTAQANILSNRG